MKKSSIEHLDKQNIINHYRNSNHTIDPLSIPEKFKEDKDIFLEWENAWIRFLFYRNFIHNIRYGRIRNCVINYITLKNITFI